LASCSQWPTAARAAICAARRLPTYIRIRIARSNIHGKTVSLGTAATSPDVEPPPKLKEIRQAAISAAERQYLQNLLSRTGGDFNEAYRLSGLSRSRLYTLLKKYK